MKRNSLLILAVLIPVVAAVAGVLAFGILTHPSTPAAEPRIVTHDHYIWKEVPDNTTVKTVNTGTLIKGSGTPSDDPGSWPGFRGPFRTNIAPPEEKLIRQWPESGPEVLWSIKLCEGHAGAAVRDGRVYLFDYDRDKREDAIRCLSLDDGRQEIWRYTYYAEVDSPHGKSRTIPTLSGDYLVALGPNGNVTCLKALTGDFVWKIDLVKDYGAKIPSWNAGQCPLVDGDRVILAPGGTSLMIAVELATGNVIWKTPNPDKWGMTHSSVAVINNHGNREYIYSASMGVVGVDASTGKILWKLPEWTVPFTNIPMPLVIDEDRFLLTGGYGAGAMMCKLTGVGANVKCEQVFRLKPGVFGAEQQTPIFYNGYIYGIIQGGQLVCLGLDGKPVWTSGPTNRFALGPYFIADGFLVVMHDEGVLNLIPATPDGFKVIAKAKVLKGNEAWAPMALVNGKLICRTSLEMYCLKVGTREK